MKTNSMENELVVSQNRLDVHSPGWIDPLDLSVTVQGSFYLVDFGWEAQPRFHRVNKAKQCSCGRPHCEAIDAVRAHLQAGGPRASDPEGMPPCPICGGKTTRDRDWDGRYTKTLGWICSKGGLRHFLEAKARQIQKQQAENPWLIPPAPGYLGVLRKEFGKIPECPSASLQPIEP